MIHTRDLFHHVQNLLSELLIPHTDSEPAQHPQHHVASTATAHILHPRTQLGRLEHASLGCLTGPFHGLLLSLIGAPLAKQWICAAR